MFKRKTSLIQIASFLTGGLILLIALSMPTAVRADGPTPDNGTCMSCHEDLYFLHDTGNWFCLKESPMACVDCHGGNPGAFTKEAAHTDRASHPVLNDDVSKCQECHPDQCTERVNIFDQTAGLNNVLVAAPYTPVDSYEVAQAVPVTGQDAEEPNTLLSTLKIIAIPLILGIAFVFYLVYRRRQEKADS